MKRYKIYITLDTYDMSYECEVKMCEIFFSDWNFVLYSVQKVCWLLFETKYTCYRSYIVIQICNTIQDNRIRFSNYKTKFTLQQHNASGMDIVQSLHSISQKKCICGPVHSWTIISLKMFSPKITLRNETRTFFNFYYYSKSFN